MELKNYQLNCINSIVNNFDNSKEILLKSPTGSGKTIMMVYTMKELLEKYSDLVFLWVSSRPKLINQSKKYAEIEQLNVIDVDNISLKSNGLEPNDILYINWEKIKNTSNKLRIKTNTNTSLDEVMEKTHEKNLKVILINDESHYGSDTVLVNTLINEIIKPFKRIDISATPSKNSYDYIHDIPLKEVRESEIIKKGIQINKDLEEYNTETRVKYDVNTLEEYIVVNGINKHLELKRKHKQVGKGIVPLLLIQLPNNDSNTYQEVIKILDRKGFNKTKGNLGIHLNEESNVDINNISDNIEVLVFKQALSMGWDNPRSHVLVMLRDSTNHSFIIQTLGRILRNPYLNYFTDEYSDLNYAYLYLTDTNVDKLNSLEKDIIDSDLGLLNRKNIETNIDKLKVIDKIDTSNMLQRILIFNKLIPQFIDTDKFRVIESEEDLQTKKYLFKDSYTTNATYVEGLDVENVVEISDMSTNDLIKKSMRYLNTSNYPELAHTIFNSLIESNKFTHLNTDEKVQHVANNLIDYTYQINKFIYKYDKYKKRYKDKWRTWETPKHLNGLKDNYSKVGIDNCLYHNYKVNGSEIERRLMLFLQSSPNVKVWYKNGDVGNEHFHVPYVYMGCYRKHFPDFLVETVDGKVLIIETKTNYMDGSTFNKYMYTRKYVEKCSENSNIEIDNYLVKLHDGELIGINSDISEFQDLIRVGKWREFSI